MKQLLAWAGSADSTITSEAVMAMAEKFNTGQEVCLQIPSARGVMIGAAAGRLGRRHNTIGEDTR